MFSGTAIASRVTPAVSSVPRLRRVSPARGRSTVPAPPSDGRTGAARAGGPGEGWGHGGSSASPVRGSRRDDREARVGLVGERDQRGQYARVALGSDVVEGAGGDGLEQVVLGERDREVGLRRAAGGVVDEHAVRQLHEVVLSLV